MQADHRRCSRRRPVRCLPHYIYCATLLLHALCFDRGSLERVVAVSALVTAVNLPWIVWLSTIRYGENYGSRVGDLALSFEIAQRLVVMMADYLVRVVLVLAAVGLAAWRWAWQEPVLGSRSATHRHIALLLGFCAVNVVVLAAAVLALWPAPGSPHKLAYELTHDCDGPIEGIVKTLQQHANRPLAGSLPPGENRPDG